jgi:hypothetical protein
MLFVIQLRAMKSFILDTVSGHGQDGRRRKICLLLSIVVFQSLIMWLLTRFLFYLHNNIFKRKIFLFYSSVTSFMPGDYDIAKMALSRIGLKGKDVPMTASGEVDYEALLKAP